MEWSFMAEWSTEVSGVCESSARVGKVVEEWEE